MVTVSASRTYPVDPQTTFDRLLPMPLPTLFSRAYGPIPAIRSSDESSPWGEVGQRRRIDLAGPGGMDEMLTDLERPRTFGYELSGFSGPMAMLVTGVKGRWDVAATGTGSRVTWTWDLSPTTAGRAAMPVFTRMWRGYARQALEELEAYLLP